MDRTFISRLMVKLAHMNHERQEEFLKRYPTLRYQEIWRYLYGSTVSPLPLPDVIFYLYAPFEVLVKRIRQKEGYRLCEKLRFNNMNQNIITKLIENAPVWLKTRIVKINTYDTPQNTHSVIINHAINILELSKKST